MRLALWLVGLTLVAGACGYSPKSGIVEDTWHRPYQVYPSTVCTQTSCVVTIMVVPESWSIKMTEDTAGEDKGRKGWREISQTVYDRCFAGLHYPECADGAK